MQPDGERAYVACTPDNFVAVIDLHSMEVVGRIQAGQSPDGLAWVMRRTEQSRIATTIPSSK
jgi:YVTN family beta-propeller protein